VFRLIEVVFLLARQRRDGPPPPVGGALLWLAGLAFGVTTLVVWFRFEAATIPFVYKVWGGLAALLATDGLLFYLDTRRGREDPVRAEAATIDGAPGLDVDGFLGMLSAQCDYLTTIEAETLRTLLNMLASGDPRQRWAGTVWLWRLRARPTPDRTASEVIVTRDEPDCINPTSLASDPEGLSQMWAEDWLSLIEKAKQRYYTVIHGDLRVWEGRSGVDYFKGHLLLVNKNSFDFKRLFVFPITDHFEKDLQDAEAVMLEESAKIAEICIERANQGVPFTQVDKAVQAMYSDFPKPLQDAARCLASAYFDLALLTRAVRGHVEKKIHHLVADARVEWRADPSDGPGIAARDLRFVIRGSEIVPDQYRSGVRPFLSAALIDDVSIIAIYGGTRRAEVDFVETPGMYVFSVSQRAINDFDAAFRAIWACHHRSRDRGDSCPFFEGLAEGGARLKTFLASFSGVFAGKVDKVRPME
jgi:hypothetical protein